MSDLSTAMYGDLGDVAEFFEIKEATLQVTQAAIVNLCLQVTRLQSELAECRRVVAKLGSNYAGD